MQGKATLISLQHPNTAAKVHHSSLFNSELLRKITITVFIPEHLVLRHAIWPTVADTRPQFL
jgi:hypothetical protein